MKNSIQAVCPKAIKRVDQILIVVHVNIPLMFFNSLKTAKSFSFVQLLHVQLLSLNILPPRISDHECIDPVQLWSLYCHVFVILELKNSLNCILQQNYNLRIAQLSF